MNQDINQEGIELEPVRPRAGGEVGERRVLGEGEICDNGGLPGGVSSGGEVGGISTAGDGVDGEGRGEIFSWEDGAEVEEWAEPVEGGELLDAMTAVLKRYVVLGRFAPETLALWIMHTYAFQLRDVTTYIGLESPQKRCGKTTLLTVLGELVNRPVVASNISSPAFFRVIEEKQPTLMIDEADTVLQGNVELRGILNAGYKRKTAYVVRVSQVGDGEWGVRNSRSAEWGMGSGRSAEDKVENPRNADWGVGDPRIAGDKVGVPGSGEEKVRNARTGRTGGRLARFSCWCPKVIATIKHLPDTLADRCIVIGMQRKTAREACERLKSLDGTEFRRKCARFVRDHAEQIAKAEPELPSDLNDRAADIWEPLLALADLAGGEWPKVARAAAVGLTAAAQEETPVGALLFDIMVCFYRNNSERAFSRELVAELNGLGERPWVELRRGKEVTEQWLARQLRPYGIGPRTIWMGERAAKGYLKEDFEEVFGRYISPLQAKAMLEELVSVAKGSEKGEDAAPRIGD